jgi:hypothetical protein
MNYTEITSATGTKVILRDNGDGSVSYIPLDEANSDYQRYLNPEAEQSTPNLS